MYRHPFIAILPLLAVVGAAVAIALDRKPTYTAEAKVDIGLVDAPAQELENQVVGNQLLAISYSRAIDTPRVIREVSRRARVSQSHAIAHLAASPIPQSTIIRIEAKDHSKRIAIGLANAGSVALSSYVGTVSQDNDGARRLARYKAAALKQTKAQARVGKLQRNHARPSVLARATADMNAANLEATNLYQLYLYTQVNSPTHNRARVLALATSADSDFDSTLQQLILIGVVAGAVLGVALALARANHRLRRRVQ